jgi:hypothetical protein
MRFVRCVLSMQSLGAADSGRFVGARRGVRGCVGRSGKWCK